MTSFGGRVVGALTLDRRVYAEIAEDGDASWQAILVVVLVPLLSGVAGAAAGGTYLSLVPADVAFSVVTGVVGWVVGGLLTYVFARIVLRGTGSISGLMRGLGFAMLPGVFRFLGVAPDVGGLVYLVAVCWGFACAVMAVREAQCISTIRAFFAALVPTVVMFVMAIGVVAFLIGLAVATGGL